MEDINNTMSNDIVEEEEPINEYENPKLRKEILKKIADPHRDNVVLYQKGMQILRSLTTREETIIYRKYFLGKDDSEIWGLILNKATKRRASKNEYKRIENSALDKIFSPPRINGILNLI